MTDQARAPLPEQSNSPLEPKADGIEVCFEGMETNANDPLEAWGRVGGVPRKGDQIAVWIDDREGEVFLTVAVVTWPAWEYAHDPGTQAPRVFLRREDGMTDEEWREVFTAIRERRHP